jgi:hypothetical protein
MPNATVRADAQATPTDSSLPDPRAICPHVALERAYTRWLKARAARDDPDSPGDDESAGKRDLEYSQAERELILSSATQEWMVWRKIELFEFALTNEMHDGPRRDRFLVLAFGAIKADLLRLRIGSDPSALENGALQ